MSDRIPMTPGGYAKLEDELKRLKHVERRNISKEIEIGPKASEIISACLREKDQAKVLTDAHLDLWDKFVKE